MRRSLFNMAIVASVLSSNLLPAQAQSRYSSMSSGRQMVDTQGTEPVTFHRSPLRYQLVDQRPIFTNCVRPEPQSPRVLFVPVSSGSLNSQTAPHACPSGLIPPGGLPTVAGPQSMRSSIPGIEPLDGLEQSRFDSKIPAGGFAPAQILPDGTSTNRLAGRVIPPGAALSRRAGTAGQTIAAQAPNTGRRAPAAATYPAASYPPISGSGNSSVRVSTDVSAVIRNRKLLQNH